MWLAFAVDFLYGYDLAIFGIFPRSIIGAIGIVTAPLIHANPVHLLSNTVPLLFLGPTLFFYYHKIASAVFLRCYFITNLLVWFFARPYLHIGASGLVYGLASFLIFFGFFRRDFLSLIISVIVLLLYGSIFYGILPANSNISWESHLAGGVVGMVTAVQFRRKRI
ncbi:rhomboid family protein [Fulvivirga imtechensis AK7]|uniref:Rhomboid family protein n=2 Tax=Fulvivirga TaxID=396811 RepID=L8JRL3_9BACT|nr:rhomboid family protein [Fulvivirga imtechensis AK7]